MFTDHPTFEDRKQERSTYTRQDPKYTDAKHV